MPALLARAELLSTIRQFFAGHGVLEVETPLLCHAGITDPAIEPLMVERGLSLGEPRFLQTSPEYAMKRLLSAGSGPIYQIARAFRDGEAGRRHNPEFSLLEWYRPDYDERDLMREVADLVQQCLGAAPVEEISYRELFQREAGIDPFAATVEALRSRANQLTDTGGMNGDADVWLDLILTHQIEPALRKREGLVFVCDYPASQAALARITEDSQGHAIARRFELYVNGIELANGYFELTDADEQRRRFAADNARREQCGQSQRPVDERLLQALSAGMPACSGVALGVDRLLMLKLGESDIRRVLAFDWERA